MTNPCAMTPLKTTHPSIPKAALPPMSINSGKLIRRQRRRLISSPDPDYTLNLPDECLAVIFDSLKNRGRARCSVVCRRWRRVEGQNRHRLCIDVRSDNLLPSLPSIFARFDSVTELSLSCYPGIGIGDEALILISLNCTNLTRLSLHECSEITADAFEALSKNCPRLKMLSCKYCAFSEPIGPAGAAGSTNLEVICLEEIDNVKVLAPMITASKSLRTLELVAPSRAKLAKQIGVESLILMAVVENCRNLQQLLLNGVNLPELSLERLASSHVNLEKLSLVKDETVGDLEMLCIAGKCKALKQLSIEFCPSVTDRGTRAIGYGCPNLVEVTLKCCEKVTLKGVEWLREKRPSLTLKFKEAE